MPGVAALRTERLVHRFFFDHAMQVASSAVGFVNPEFSTAPPELRPDSAPATRAAPAAPTAQAPGAPANSFANLPAPEFRELPAQLPVHGEAVPLGPSTRPLRVEAFGALDTGVVQHGGTPARPLVGLPTAEFRELPPQFLYPSKGPLRVDAAPDALLPDGRLIRPGLDLGSIPFFQQPLELSPRQTPLGGEPIVLKEQGGPRQATTPIAKAAAQTAKEIVPAAPKADKVEIAALELFLAEPQNQAMVRAFGGKLEPLPTWTTVGQGIEARYGQDLGSRLYQLQNAQRAVEGKFFTAMDQALQNPPPAPPPFSTLNQLRGQPEPVSAQPGWTYEPGSSHWDGAGPSWRFDPGAFSRAWAAGDSAAQKAFAHLHGPDALKYVPEPNAEGGAPAHWALADRPVVLGRALDREEGLTPDAVAGAQAGSHNSAQSPGWAPSRVQRADTELDPSRITKLIDKEFVWFDPQRGFCTDADNLKPSGIDKAFPIVFAGVMSVMTAGVAGAAMGVTSAATATVGQSMVMGAVGNATLQFVGGGRFSFQQMLTSALTAGAASAISSASGIGQMLNSSDAATRAMGHLGRAGVQGVLQRVSGGKFINGFANSALASIGGEITQHLQSQIDQMPGLSEGQRSMMSLLSRAAGSAVRIAGSGDPAAGFANDFLSAVVGDAVQAEVETASDAEYPEVNANARPGSAESVAESDWTSGNGPEDRVVGREEDPNFIDVASLNGAPLARLAARGLALMSAEMASYGYRLVAPEVYFLPDAPGAKPIRIDGAFSGPDGRVVFGEAKIGDHADFTANQRNGVDALREGKGTFYGSSANDLANRLGIKPDANGRFHIPADKIQGVYAATYERNRPPSSRMQNLNESFRRMGGFTRGSDI